MNLKLLTLIILVVIIYSSLRNNRPIEHLNKISNPVPHSEDGGVVSKIRKLGRNL